MSHVQKKGTHQQEEKIKIKGGCTYLQDHKRNEKKDDDNIQKGMKASLKQRDLP